MRMWVTEIKAIHNISGEMATFGGPNIEAPSYELAVKWCQQNAGWLHVIGELIEEIPCKPGTYEADFDKRVRYTNDN